MEQVLKVLKEKKGEYVSGQELAGLSGITRSGIWKQIEQLRELGYNIESSPRKGYRFIGTTNDLNSMEIQDGLATIAFGRPVFYREEVDSTTKWAKSLANQGAVEGTIVIAEKQTGGRGRMGRSWASASGLGLWLTWILRPKMSASQLAGLTLLTAVTMSETIKTVAGVQVQIKWPNDLFYEGKKLAGILAEINGEMDLVNYLIMSIGLNVNHEEADFPAELKGRATSLKIITGKELSRRIILQQFLANFESAYYLLPQKGMANLVEYAKKHSATLGKEVLINQGFGGIIEGKAIDLDIDGSLLLEDKQQKVIRVYSGDIMEQAIGDRQQAIPFKG